MGNQNYEEQTDTHLAKYYNELLISVIAKCSQLNMELEMTEHISMLKAYYGGVKNLVKLTQFLFKATMIENPYKDTKHVFFNGKDSVSISDVSKFVIVGIGHAIRDMPSNKDLRNMKVFNDIKEELFMVDSLIMDGLQQRNMLVRTSSQDPRGKDSIDFWGKKTGMNKGLLNEF